MPKPLLPGLLVPLVLLAGCSQTSAPATSPSASASGGSSAGAPSDASSPSAAASPSAGSTSGAQDVADPCTTLDATRVSQLTGVAVRTGQPSSVTGSKICTWLPKDTKASGAALFTAQVGSAQGGSLSDAEAPLKKQFGGTITKTTVPGAEDARYVTGKASNVQVIDVLALKSGVFYQVLAASPREVGKHKADVYRLAEALLKG